MIGSLFGQKKPSQDERILARIKETVSSDSSLGMRVYRTKNGFRCLVTSRTFDPLSTESHDLLSRLGSDEQYMKFCRVQECYRARLSPKPWRCGVPRPPFRFPFSSPADEQQYRAWEKESDETVKSYSTCAVIGDFGSSSIHPEVESVLKLHDHFACEGDGPLS